MAASMQMVCAQTAAEKTENIFGGPAIELRLGAIFEGGYALAGAELKPNAVWLTDTLTDVNSRPGTRIGLGLYGAVGFSEHLSVRLPLCVALDEMNFDLQGKNSRHSIKLEGARFQPGLELMVRQNRDRGLYAAAGGNVSFSLHKPKSYAPAFSAAVNMGYQIRLKKFQISPEIRMNFMPLPLLLSQKTSLSPVEVRRIHTFCLGVVF